MQEVSSALLYLHRQDVLHGDLTAANVLLAGVRHRGRTSRTFQCKVADFGLSRFMEAAQLTTATVGTGALLLACDEGLAGLLTVWALEGHLALPCRLSSKRRPPACLPSPAVSHMPLELISSGKLSKAVDVFAFGTLCWGGCWAPKLLRAALH